MRKFVILAIVLIFSTLPIQSQEDNETGDVNIRIAHLSVDTPIINLMVDGELTSVQDLSYGQITEWYSLPSGTYTLALTSTTSENLPDPLEFEFAANSWTTIAIIGSIGRDSVALQPIVEDYSEIGRGEARIGIFHAIEGIPALDITRNDNTLFQFVSYPGSTTDNDGNPNDGFVSTNLIANTYELQMLLSGEENEVLVDLNQLQFSDGNNYFIAAIGTPDNPSYIRITTDLSEIRRTTRASLLSEASMETNQVLRIAHFSSGTPSVDIYINEELFVSQLGFANSTDFLPLPTNAQTISIVPVGLDLNDALLPPTNISFTTEQWVTAALIGTLDNNSLTVQLLEEDFSELTSTDVNISIFQAIPGVSPINVEVDDNIVIRLLGYPGSQGDNDGMESFTLVDGNYNLVIKAAVNNQVIVNLEDQRFIGGRNYLLATIRANPPYVFRSTDVVTAPAENEE